jgi:hypothetical protein
MRLSFHSNSLYRQNSSVPAGLDLPPLFSFLEMQKQFPATVCLALLARLE